MLKFSGQAGVPDDVRASLQLLIDDAHLMSPQLVAFFTFVRNNPLCHLFVNVLGAGTGAHGDTGTFISLPRAPSGTLIEEAFMSQPHLILGQHESFIKVTVEAGPGSSPVNASTTLLHELELHAAPGGLLLQRVAQQDQGDDARLRLVLDRMRGPDDHVDLDRHEQYVRSAARIRQAKAGTGLAGWGSALMNLVARDAFEQFVAYEMKHTDESSVARGQWLATQIRAIQADGPDAATVTPKPPPRQVPTLTAAPGGDVSGYVAQRVFERAGMLDLAEEARTLFSLPLGRVLDLYCKQVVPALLAQAPPELTDVVQQKVFLEYHGVPDMVALDAIEHAPAISAPTVKVISSWPPGLPVFWLSDAERDSWNPRTSLPESVRSATGIQHGDRLYLDGQLYRAAVLDAKPETGPRAARFFPHEPTGKFIALLRQ